MKNICVIEDNSSIRKLFCTILQKSSYSTSDFGDGSSSVAWLESNKPDLIIMDILLPDINGTELFSIVRNISGLETIPIIAITGFTSDQDKNNFISLGFTSYLSKPINTAVLVEEVKKIIG